MTSKDSISFYIRQIILEIKILHGITVILVETRETIDFEWNQPIPRCVKIPKSKIGPARMKDTLRLFKEELKKNYPELLL